MSDLIKITDHVIQAKERLIQQYKESINVNKLLSVIIEPIQELEDELYDIYVGHGLASSIGAQLDIQGRIVGVSRLGRTDDEYRTAIYTQIIINSGSGTPEDILSATRLIVKGIKKVSYYSLHPYGYRLFIEDGDALPAKFKEFLYSISRICVPEISVTYANTNNYLTLGELTTELANFDVQSGTFFGDQVSPFEVQFNTTDIEQFQVTNQVIEINSDKEGLAEVLLNENPLLVDNIYYYDIGDGNNLILNLFDANEMYVLSEYGAKLAENV